MNSSELEPMEGAGEHQPAAAPDRRPTSTLATLAGGSRRLLRRRFVRPIVALAAIAALAGAAYVLGGPPLSSAALADAQSRQAANPGFINNGITDTSGGTTKEVAAATAGPAAVPVVGDGTTSSGNGDNALVSSLTSALIVRNGQVVLEVSDIDKAVSSAQTAISGLGGYVSDSTRSGIDQYVTASVTYRLPVAHWDEALKAIHAVGSKVLSEQTGSSDVTAQAVDLDARIANLKTTETALQAIMTRATVITDVIAVETQLSQVQGEIESLTAQTNRLKDQAAMSTLTVSFQLPSATVAQDWTLGSQVDQALAALVRIGQGLATIAVWFLIVAVPSAIGLLILFGLWKLARRARGRDRSKAETPTAA